MLRPFAALRVTGLLCQSSHGEGTLVNTHNTIAYFSMEIGLEAGMPTYSGGLGVLAGDTIRAAADLKIPMIAVTLLHRKGYFYQRLDASGWQSEEPAGWVVADFLVELAPRVSVTVEGRPVSLRCWQYAVTGVSGFTVPVYFLDADLPDNTEWDRTLTHFLYGGDQRYRLSQEVLLGIGGVRMLRALGLPGELRYGLGRADDGRGRRVVEHAPTAAGGIWDEWHEGRAQRRAESECARRLVD